MCSADARSEGQSGYSPREEVMNSMGAGRVDQQTDLEDRKMKAPSDVRNGRPIRPLFLRRIPSLS
jgi:hypothetical protein